MEAKKYGCIAEFENEYQESSEEIKPGFIGYFGNDKIYIKGKLLTKGMFPRICVRWISDRNNGNGLFGKGILVIMEDHLILKGLSYYLFINS